MVNFLLSTPVMLVAIMSFSFGTVLGGLLTLLNRCKCEEKEFKDEESSDL